MSDDLDGWICLHRELLEKPIWSNSSPEQKCILIALLMLANHKPKKWEWKGEKFMVKRGQMITSLESISVKAGPGISIQNVRTAIARFEKLEFLTNQSTKTGRLITICNYSKYQDKKIQTNKEDNKDLTESQQRPNKDLTPNNNDNNDNKEDLYTPEEPKIPEKKPSGKQVAAFDFSSWPALPSDQVMIDWKAARKAKRAVINQTVIENFGKELSLAVTAGYTVDQCLSECITRNWQGFHAEWMTNAKIPVYAKKPELKIVAPHSLPPQSLEERLKL
jgi:hypothetical protein